MNSFNLAGGLLQNCLTGGSFFEVDFLLHFHHRKKKRKTKNESLKFLKYISTMPKHNA